MTPSRTRASHSHVASTAPAFLRARRPLARRRRPASSPSRCRPSLLDVGGLTAPPMSNNSKPRVRTAGGWPVSATAARCEDGRRGAATRRSSCTSISRARCGRTPCSTWPSATTLPLPVDSVEALTAALRVHRLRALHRGLDPHHQRHAHRRRLPADRGRLRGGSGSARRGLPRGHFLADRARDAGRQLGRPLRGLLRRRPAGVRRARGRRPAHA